MPRALSPVWTIAKSTYKEVIRDRLLYGIILVAFLVTASSFFLASISLDQSARVTQNVGQNATYLFSLFICVFVATNSIYKDIDRRALYLLFAKPISRAQYVLGKYLGSLLLLLTTLGLLGGLFVLGALFTDRSVVLGTLVILAYSFLEIAFLLALATLFASFTAPLNAALYTVAFFIIGHSFELLKNFVAQSENGFARGLVSILYYIFPNLEKFNVRAVVLYQLPIPAAEVLWMLAYWVLYTSVALYLAVLVTKHREV